MISEMTEVSGDQVAGASSLRTRTLFCLLAALKFGTDCAWRVFEVVADRVGGALGDTDDFDGEDVLLRE